MRRQSMVVLASVVLLGPLAAAANQGPEGSSAQRLSLPEGLAAQASGDMQVLVDRWLTPLLRWKRSDMGYIEPWPPESVSAAEPVFRQGMEAFCAATAGSLTSERVLNLYTGKPDGALELACTSAGQLSGWLKVWGYDDKLYVRWSSATMEVTQAERDAAARASYERQLALNGPTGWFVTDQGKYRFVRLGTAAQRHLLSFGGVEPKDIASVSWSGTCCDVTVKLRNGQTRLVNEANIMHMTYEASGPMMSSYGISPGFPIVIRDPRTGADSEAFFPNFKSLRSLELDPPAAWEKGKRIAVAPARPAPPRKSASAPVGTKPSPALSATFEVGTRVCHSAAASAEFPLNFAYQGQQATERLVGRVTLSGFVEASSGPRIQIRVGGIAFLVDAGQNRHSRPGRLGTDGSESLDAFNNNGTNLKDGAIFWDRAAAWYNCE